MKDFDELLDEVLREEGQAMPRPGLERRVMARLRSDERPFAGWLRSRWLTAGAMAAAACVVAAVVWVAPQLDRDYGAPVPKVQYPAVIAKRETKEPRLTTPPANGQGSHLSDDKTVAKMGHPAKALARYHPPQRALGSPLRV